MRTPPFIGHWTLVIGHFLILPLPAATLILGDPVSETAHELSAEYSEIVSGSHPALWIMSTRASAQIAPGRPTDAIDGNPATAWRVSGPPVAPMVRGNWIELDLNRAADLDQLTVQWLGPHRYAYQIYEKPFSDLRKLVHEGVSGGQDAEPETIRLPKSVRTRALRIEFATLPGNPIQGIREIRLGELPFPAAYPPAAYKDAPVDFVVRPYYVEFERMLSWPVFNPKIPHADGGTARRLLPRNDAFDGGRLDFTLPVTPKKTNWITLKIWESHPQSMTQRGNLVVLQTLDGDATQINRTFLPKLVTEEQQTDQEWYGPKPQPGRWSYVHYQLPADLVAKRKALRLRLQGVGHIRRDYPMRAPSPPIYTITSATSPVIPE